MRDAEHAEKRRQRSEVRRVRREAGRRQWANLHEYAAPKRPTAVPPPVATPEQKQAELALALAALDRGRIGKALRALGVEVPCARDFWCWVHTRRIERPEFSEAQRAQSREWLGLRQAAA